MGKRIYEPLKEGDKFGYMTLTGEIQYRYDANRKRKFYRVWCSNCHSYQWVRDDLLRVQRSCGCLSKGYRARYLFCKKGLAK